MSVPPTPVPSEVEAKLLVQHEAHFRALVRLEQLGAYRFLPRDVARLRSTYFDTPTFSLARHGVALRLRNDGGRWEATAKWAGKVDGAVHERPELTVPLPGRPRGPCVLPDGPLRLQLTALVAGRALGPILVTEIRRRRLDVVRGNDPEPRPLRAELAFDRVRLLEPGQRVGAASYFEVEIEQRAGTRRDVTEVARLLRRRFDLKTSRLSKFARGLQLVYGADFATRRDAAIDVHDTLGVAVRTIVRRHLRRLREHDPGTRIGTEPEALHDMRVACRRLRAAIRAFEPAIPSRQRARFERDLEWLGQQLGGVRDLDVQLELLARYRAKAPAEGRERLTSFHDYLEIERQQRRAMMLAALDSDRYFRLLRDLEDFALGQPNPSQRSPTQAPIALVGRRAIKRAFRRLLKLGDKIGATPTDEELHRLRIRAKRLRYLLEFLRDVTGKPGRRLVKDMIRLQDLLGAHHDAVVAAAFVRHYIEGPGAQSPAPTVLALGTFIGADLRRAEDMRADFRKAWSRFARRRTVTDEHAVLRQLRMNTTAHPPAAPPPTRTEGGPTP